MNKEEILELERERQQSNKQIQEDLEALRQKNEILEEELLCLKQKFDDAIRDKSSLYPLTEKQSKMLQAMRENIKGNGKIQIREIARKLSLSASLVSYTKIQFIKRGLIKEATTYEA